MKKPYLRFAFHGLMGLFLSLLLVVFAFAGMPEKRTATVEEQTIVQEEGQMKADRASKVLGAQVHNQKGEKLGKVGDLIFAPESGQIIYVLLSADDSLEIKDKWFVIPWQVLRLDTDKDNYLLDMDKTALISAPGFNRNDWPDMANEHWREEIYNYYHQKPYSQEKTAIKPEKDAGNIIDNTIITAKVKAALLSHSTAQGLNLSVETSQGEVRLSGAVDTVEQARKAVTVARAVQGVRTVKDDISVKSCPEHELC